MLVEAIKHPIRYTMMDGTEVRLLPGVPVDLPEPQAKTLLTKAPDRVRAIDTPAEPNGKHSPVYWESAGRILGPATVSHVAKVADRFWLCIEYAESWRWITERLLRSKRDFDEQGQPTCNCCGGSDFWTSIYDMAVCSRCHPPAASSLVKRRKPCS